MVVELILSCLMEMLRQRFRSFCEQRDLMS